MKVTHACVEKTLQSKVEVDLPPNNCHPRGINFPTVATCLRIQSALLNRLELAAAVDSNAETGTCNLSPVAIRCWLTDGSRPLNVS